MLKVFQPRYRLKDTIGAWINISPSTKKSFNTKGGASLAINREKKHKELENRWHERAVEEGREEEWTNPEYEYQIAIDIYRFVATEIIDV